jgi:heme-degrading monooxygenase HmoA
MATKRKTRLLASLDGMARQKAGGANPLRAVRKTQTRKAFQALRRLADCGHRRRTSAQLRASRPALDRILGVSVVKINAITVPRERFAEFEQRFAARAGKVEDATGFEGFELLRPNDDREVCLVLTRWRSEDDFQAWLASRDFAAGHAQHRQSGPVGTASQLWSFDVLERKAGGSTDSPAA